MKEVIETHQERITREYNLPVLVSKAIIFNFETHTLTYNGKNIVAVDRAGKIVASEKSPYIQPTLVDAQYKLKEMLAKISTTV